jgi:hypothetical protein
MPSAGGASRRRHRHLPWLVALLVLVASLLVAGRVAQEPVGPRSPFLVGAAQHDNGDPAALERAAGSTLGVRRTFWKVSKLDASVAVARHDVADGRVPLLSYKVGDWSAAADGAMDDWAREAASRLSALGGTVMVAIHHEPEGDGDIATWKRMQQRLAPLFDVPHVQYGVVLTGYAQIYGPQEYSFDAVWPDGAPVKFLGLDVYESFGARKKNGGTKHRWTDLEKAYFVDAGRFARRKHVFWGLAETGLTDAAFDTPRGRLWFAVTARGLARQGGSFLAYFDSRQNSGTNSWPLQGAKREAYLRLLANPPLGPVRPSR